MADISPKMLSHYVCNWMLKARAELEEGRPEQADAVRIDLLGKLRGLYKDTAVTSCVNYLYETSWKTSAEVDAFQRHYEKADPTVRGFEEALKKLAKR